LLVLLVRVRRAGPEDLDALASLFEAYRRFYEQPDDLPKSRAFVAERLTRGDSVIFVAEEAGELRGFTQLYPLFSSTACRRLWLLNDLYTTGSARRKGVARALMEAARGHAIETGATGIELSTAHTNLPAQRLYESLGYVMDRTFRAYSLRL
jgi:ribosomal protein S18 acetylase RimI-like enzyme